MKNTKGELYQNIAEKNGCVFYNPENAILEELINKNSLADQAIPYGYGLESVTIDSSNKNPFLCLDIKPVDVNARISIKTSLVGNYNYENVLCAITVGQFMGISIELIKSAIESYTPSNSRSQLVKTKNNEEFLNSMNQ